MSVFLANCNVISSTLKKHFPQLCPHLFYSVTSDLLYFFQLLTLKPPPLFKPRNQYFFRTERVFFFSFHALMGPTYSGSNF